MTVDGAIRRVESWLERPNVRIVAEGKAGNLTTDAHLAALAIESRVTTHLADTDFLRFSGVRWLNPLD